MPCFKNPRWHPMITPQGFWHTHNLISPLCFVHIAPEMGQDQWSTGVSCPVCSRSVLRDKRKVRLWEKQVCILTLPSLKSPLVGWSLGKTPFGRSCSWHAQSWGRAGRAELLSTACPALPVCRPGARNSLSYTREKRRAALHWHLGQENTNDWNNSIMGFGCPTTAQGPPETPTQRQRGAWGLLREAHLSWLSECTFLSYGCYSQRERQARLFKMYF